MSRGPTIDTQSVTSVLSEIADTVSETLELDEVFDRVAASVRKLIPFFSMGVVRIVDGERVVLHAHSCPPEDPGGERLEKPLAAWSPRWRPRPARGRIDDARAELDPTFPMDAEVLGAGMGSALWEPFRQGSSFVGGVWLCSRATHAFNGEHQEVLRTDPFPLLEREAAGISRDAREWLLAHPWPGNVRELRNAIERAILLCDGGLITRHHLPAPMVPARFPNPAAPFPPEGVHLGAMERSLVEKALTQAKGNKSKAARLLGLTRAQIYSRMEKHGIQ